MVRTCKLKVRQWIRLPLPRLHIHQKSPCRPFSAGLVTSSQNDALIWHVSDTKEGETFYWWERIKLSLLDQKLGLGDVAVFVYFHRLTPLEGEQVFLDEHWAWESEVEALVLEESTIAAQLVEQNSLWCELFGIWARKDLQMSHSPGTLAPRHTFRVTESVNQLQAEHFKLGQ